ncbi:MAG: putative transcriptional regulator [Bradyrhizobium sp.]|jgi:TetR/AcrR family transcriptional repressor of nem operon|nr:putative transcriptional regulator [Bradyrhizobium sp.]MEA2867057.1 TetR/AcrR family transcriptional regulator, transcriptional repressor for nem operon [Bradyrhizobium sp.]
MRVSKEQAAENRAALLQAASRLFRQRGIDGVGVADIAREAGLTHGALYAHFKSKDELAAEAFSYGFEGNMAQTRAWAGDRRPSFEEHLDGLLSIYMRDKAETGCPMAASASEIARQGCAVSASFTRAFEEMGAMLEASMEDAIPASQRRRLALAAVAAEIGAIAVSRAVAKTDAALADEVLQSVRETVGTAYKVETAGVG